MQNRSCPTKWLEKKSKIRLMLCSEKGPLPSHRASWTTKMSGWRDRTHCGAHGVRHTQARHTSSLLVDASSRERFGANIAIIQCPSSAHRRAEGPSQSAEHTFLTQATCTYCQSTMADATCQAVISDREALLALRLLAQHGRGPDL